MRTLKSSITFFTGSFTSDSSGGVRIYLASDQVRKMAGQATRIRVSVVGVERTASAQLTLKLFDTASPNQKPSELAEGYAATYTSSPITTLVPQPFDIAGPFCDNVDLVLEVQASTGTNKEEWRGAIYGTLFFD